MGLFGVLNMARRFLTGFTAAFFTFHSTVTTVAMRAFVCAPVDADDKDLRLASDYSVRCYTGWHQGARFGLALPMVIIYTVITPIIAAVYIHRNHHRTVHHLIFLTR